MALPPFFRQAATGTLPPTLPSCTAVQTPLPAGKTHPLHHNLQSSSSKAKGSRDFPSAAHLVEGCKPSSYTAIAELMREGTDVTRPSKTCKATYHQTTIFVVYRGDRAVLEKCQQGWHTAGNSQLEQSALSCQLWGGSAASYLDQQCSKGYEGPLCTICTPGYGLSGKQHPCGRCA